MRIRLLAVLLCTTACVHRSGHRSVVILSQTDELVRPVTRAVVELMEPPAQSHRVIGHFIGEDVADDLTDVRGCPDPDCALWRNLKYAAGDIGAHALVFKQREVYPCVAAAYSTTAVSGYEGASVSQGARILTCVRLNVDAIVVDTPIDCDATQICRKARGDASTTKPAKKTPLFPEAAAPAASHP